MRVAKTVIAIFRRYYQKKKNLILEGSHVRQEVGSDENRHRIGQAFIGCHSEILPDRGLNNEEPVSHANAKADRFTIWKHRTDENNEK